MTILDKIVANTRQELVERKRILPLSVLREAVKQLPPKQGTTFRKSLSQSGIRIIAEIKKASPSRGLICADFQPARIATEYAVGGAAAISVLTDKRFFQGDLTFLEDVARTVKLPLLRKDFIVDTYQIYEGARYGANAILLLANVLSASQLAEFRQMATSLGMDALVEVHNMPDLEKALYADAKIIGVNNRDLTTFTVNLETSLKLAEEIPAGKLRVSESGIRNTNDIQRLSEAGYDAFLIGESLMSQSDRTAALIELRGATCG
ncbi:indole-3-glycerol phosphate synthase TrpC [bacterium]|nr:indole-3-glycerol phosphate synthase TrpC [bacterium]